MLFLTCFLSNIYTHSCSDEGIGEQFGGSILPKDIDMQTEGLVDVTTSTPLLPELQSTPYGHAYFKTFAFTNPGD